MQIAAQNGRENNTYFKPIKKPSIQNKQESISAQEFLLRSHVLYSQDQNANK